MGISGVGGVGSAGGAAGLSGLSGVGVSSTVATNASGPTASGAVASGSPPGAMNPAGTLTADMQNLVNTLKDFTSAEILIALMLAKAAGGDDDDDRKKSRGSAAGAGLLAGMALAGQLGQQHNLQLDLTTQFQAPPSVTGAASVGLSLNVDV